MQEILSLWKVITVMLSFLSLFIPFPVVFSVAFWSSFAYAPARTILYIYFLPLFTTESDTFFLLPHHKKG